MTFDAFFAKMAAIAEAGGKQTPQCEIQFNKHNQKDAPSKGTFGGGLTYTPASFEFVRIVSPSRFAQFEIKYSAPQLAEPGPLIDNSYGLEPMTFAVHGQTPGLPIPDALSRGARIQWKGKTFPYDSITDPDSSDVNQCKFKLGSM